MPLYIRDPEVDRLTRRLTAITHLTKTELVRRALTHELEREENRPSLAELGVAFVRDLRASGDAARAQPADKAFVDTLYEQP